MSSRRAGKRKTLCIMHYGKSGHRVQPRGAVPDPGRTAMADEEQLHRLREQGVGPWNTWRRENVGAHVNLRGGDLHRTDLGGANLRKANLSGADLSGADLSRADLSEANLSG